LEESTCKVKSFIICSEDSVVGSNMVVFVP